MKIHDIKSNNEISSVDDLEGLVSRAIAFKTLKPEERNHGEFETLSKVFRSEWLLSK